SFKNHESGPSGGGADEFPRAHHPADIGDPKEDVLLLAIHVIGDFFGYLSQRTGMRMYAALRFAGGSRGVNDDGTVFGIESPGWEFILAGLKQVIKPKIASFLPRNIFKEPFGNNDVFDGGDGF